MDMRTTRVYSITMPPDLARQAEALAKKENRTIIRNIDIACAVDCHTVRGSQLRARRLTIVA